MLLVCDLETSGLKMTDVILECAYARVHPETLEILSKDETVVRQRQLPYLEPVVREMHEESGLLGLLYPDTMPDGKYVYGHAELDNWLCQAFQSMEATPASILLCGHSIQFDKKRIEAFCQNAAAYLSHRTIDLSTIRELMRYWQPLGAPQLPKKDVAHRAMADVLQAIENLKWYRDNAFRLKTLAKDFESECC